MWRVPQLINNCTQWLNQAPTLEHTDLFAQISLPYHEDSWWSESSFAEMITLRE